MSKATFEISGIDNSLKPTSSGTQSSNDIRNALGALHQTDFAPLRARAQGFDSLTVWVNPAVIENFYMPVLNASGVPCTYVSGISPAASIPGTNSRIDILEVNSSPDPQLYWVQGTESVTPTIPNISTSGVPICAVWHRQGSVKITNNDDSTNSYIYRDMRPLYGYLEPFVNTAFNAKSGSIIQTVATEYTTFASLGTTLVVLDDTKPTWAEGNEVAGIQTSITPTSASNYLLITAYVWLSQTTTAQTGWVMVYQDPAGVDECKGMGSGYLNDIYPQAVPLVHRQIAGTTSAITFKFRAGLNTASTLVVNGKAQASAARQFGGALISKVVIQEIKA